jgi:adenine-specific DNA methylase
MREECLNEESNFYVEGALSNERYYPYSGILFRNDQKREDRDRDYRGTADVDCPHCGARSTWWLSAWLKSGRKGKFMSLAFKAKDADVAVGDRRQATTERASDEDIPF